MGGEKKICPWPRFSASLSASSSSERVTISGPLLSTSLLQGDRGILRSGLNTKSKRYFSRSVVGQWRGRSGWEVWWSPRPEWKFHFWGRFWRVIAPFLLLLARLWASGGSPEAPVATANSFCIRPDRGSWDRVLRRCLHGYLLNSSVSEIFFTLD